MLSIEYLRQFRFFGYAIFDLSLAFLGILALSPLFNKLFLKFKLKVPVSSWMLLTLPLSILIHLMVLQFTPMTKNFFDPSDHYLLKIFIIALTVLGIKGIKRVK